MCTVRLVRMEGDGNGWVDGPGGKRVWGKYGAAGLFLRAGGTVLLQHRAHWVADGGTWALPGGARDSHETAQEAALRETVEECGIDTSLVSVEKSWSPQAKSPAGPTPPSWRTPRPVSPSTLNPTQNLWSFCGFR